jgi:hypothetical protein
MIETGQFHTTEIQVQREQFTINDGDIGKRINLSAFTRLILTPLPCLEQN